MAFKEGCPHVRGGLDEGFHCSHSPHACITIPHTVMAGNVTEDIEKKRISSTSLARVSKGSSQLLPTVGSGRLRFTSITSLLETGTNIPDRFEIPTPKSKSSGTR